MAIAKEILAKLKLDSKEFKSNLSESTAGIIKTTASVTALGTAVLVATKLTANYRDETIKAARAAGSTAEDFSALKYAANLSGVSMETLSKGLQKISAPSKEAQASMARMGVSLSDSSGKAKTQNQILNDIADKLKALPTPAQKSAAAVKLFGEEGAKMVNLLGGGSEALKQMTAEAAAMGLVFDEKAGVAAELFNDNITRVTSSVQGLVQQVTGSIIEFVNQTGVMQALSKAVQTVTQWWMNLDDTTKNIIITIGAVVSGIAAFILAAAGIVAITPSVVAAITAMTGGLNLVVLGVVTAIAAFAAIAVGAIQYWGQVKTAIQPAIEAVERFGVSISSGLERIRNAFAPIFSGIGQVIKPVVDAIKSWLGITDQSTDKISYLGTAAKIAFGIINAAIIITIGALEVFNDAVNLVATSIEQLGVAFKAGMEWDFNKAEVALNKIKESANALANDIKKIGTDIAEGFSKPIVINMDSSAIEKAVKSMNKLKDDSKKLVETNLADRFMAVARGLLSVAQMADYNLNIFQKINKTFLTGIDIISDWGKFFREGEEEAKKLNEQLQNGEISVDQFNEAMKGIKITNVISAITAALKIAVESIKVASDIIVSNIKAGLERATYYIDLFSGLYSNSMDDLIKETEDKENERIALIKSKYDEQIKAIEDAESQKNAALEFAANERLLMLDEEYQTAREKAEEDFALKMEEEEAKYEIEKEALLSKAIDKEQRMLIEAMMDADHKLYMENLQAAHDAEMNQLADEYSGRQKATTADLKAAQLLAEQESKDQIESLTEQKNTDLENAEDAKNNKLAQLEKKRQEDDKLMKKLQLLMSWKAEKSMFEQTKGMKIAETMITGVAGAASAFAMAAGSIPIVGIIIGAVLAAAVLAMTIASAAQIGTQQAPQAPVGLFLASGGVLAGASHAAGGISATLEGGEGVIDRARTEQLMNSIDAASSGSGKNLSIIFQPGSIVNNGEQLTDSFVDKISYAISRRMERQGVFA